MTTGQREPAMRMDIAAARRRCANAIKNTPVGRYLERALGELQDMRDREETIKAGRCVSASLCEIAAEIRDPAKWAAMMITKGASPRMTVGEAMDLIEGTLRHALALMLEADRLESDRKRAEIADAFLDDMEESTP